MDRTGFSMLVVLAAIVAAAAYVLGAMEGAAWIVGGLLVAAVVLAGLALFVYLRHPEPPDLIGGLGLTAFEREGFCFALVPAMKDGKGHLLVVYQNRYDERCEADLLVKPEAEAGRAGLRTVRLSVRCADAGTGREEVPWEVPAALAGRPVRLQVAADVRYPHGRGAMVRWREGTTVGTIEAAESGFLETLIGTAAGLTFTVPAADLPSTTPDPATTPDASAGAAATGPGGCVLGSGMVGPGVGSSEAGRPEPGAALGSPPRADAQARPAMVDRTPPPRIGSISLPIAFTSGTGRLPGHSSAWLATVLEVMSRRNAIHWQRSQVRWRRAGVAMTALGPGVLGVGFGSALLAYGVAGLGPGWRLPRKLIALLLGGASVLGGVLCLVRFVFFLIGAFKVRFATSPEEAARGFCARALEDIKNNAQDWVAVCEYVAYPAFESLEPEESRALARRWRDLRESLAGEGQALDIGRVQATEHPELGKRVVTLAVEVRTPSGTVELGNGAVELDGHWFLAALSLADAESAGLLDVRRRLVVRAGRRPSGAGADAVH